MNDRRAERSHARWTWTIAGVLTVLLLVLWALGRGPGGAAACCAIPAIHAPSADADRNSGAAHAAKP
ncbi:hypothetical protein FHW12_003411 [Dokdonella fugitiva]|uniref:Uncharacterized protein n=1 Tax=Dokdonella fugitiva TaxID=328517 RepID=A0A839F6J8_9GAMM|nr:hypothetical protein [Dokdonella fugitiva]MBA8889168.1 hypothetical protein [Dokdonella fugitiva]